MSFSLYNFVNGMVLQTSERGLISIESSMSLFVSGLDGNGVAMFGSVYVPELASEDEICNMHTNLPNNLTRINDLKGSEYPIALVPYLNSTCGDLYFRQVARDGGTAALVYSPDGLSPMAWVDESLNLSTNYGYSAFIINSSAAGSIMDYMTNNQDSSYRVAGTIESHQTGNLSSIWTYVLAILAGLLALLVFISLCMHLIFFNKRRDLRRRLQRGEVDPASLGMKQLTVPVELINKLPIRLYRFGASNFPHPRDRDVPLSIPKTPPKPWFKSFNNGPSPANNSLTSGTEMQNMNHHGSQANSFGGYSQTNCAICLDDYVEHVTLVRELPCLHIYHSECIDPFLLTRSALCPLCKTSVLPKGYLPPDLVITNSTLRQERRLRRANGISNSPTTSTAESSDIQDRTGFRTNHFIGIVRRTFPWNQTRRGLSDSSFTHLQERDQNHGTSGTSHNISSPNTLTDAENSFDHDNEPIITHNQSVLDPQTRHDMGHGPDSVNLAGVPAPSPDDYEQRQSKWRKLFSKIFPTF
ncbi:hypothetical protein NADFUDRAFT_46777 [Nadsonia fulvescens var. elongata DSM 6958]|uniref:RING-type domain-containing protein n=1 Tax=Nadsonia fulvescens var. elongata DSM 6958 TaxID=857566 RepID=A0A1E3PJ75_9ASCO|nr:hypothetical protein NADFUDRAFT_46777 [Nadsonia fulvescens var. elongata DSM 6958]